MKLYRIGLLSLATLLAPLARASAQGPFNHWEGAPPCLPFAPENRIGWLGTNYGNASAFGRIVTLELDADMAPDAVVVAGGVAVALFDPAYYDQPLLIPGLSSVCDVATLPLGGDAERDMLLATDANGLSSVGWSNGAFTAPQVIARGSWVNARTLHVDDLDGDGMDDIVGVSANGLSVLTRVGSNGSFPGGTTRTLTAQVFDAVSVNWDDDANGTRELAVVAADGLHVYSPSGEIAFEAYASTFGCIARVHCADVAPGGELLAWARGPAGGGAELVVRGARTEPPKPLYITNAACPIDSFVPKALLAGNYDGDGSDDLLMVRDGAPYAIVLRNITFTSGGHFDPADDNSFDIVPLTDGSASFSGVGIPSFAQLDLDGPDDVLVPVKGVNEVLAFRTLPYFRTAIGDSQPPTSDAVFPGYTEFQVGVNDALGELRLAFKVLSQYAGGSYPLFNRVQLKLWIQNETSPGVFFDVDHNGVYTGYHDLVLNAEATGLASQFQWIDIANLNAIKTGATWDPQTHVYAELRFQRVSNGTVLQMSPKFFGGFTLPKVAGVSSVDDACFAHLRSVGIANKIFLVPEHERLTPHPADEQLVGAYVPMNALPNFDGTAVPHEVVSWAPSQLFFSPPPP